MGAADVVENRRAPTSVRRHFADDVRLSSRAERIKAGQRAANVAAVMVYNVDELARPNGVVGEILRARDDRIGLLIPEHVVRRSRVALVDGVQRIIVIFDVVVGEDVKQSVRRRRDGNCVRVRRVYNRVGAIGASRQIRVQGRVQQSFQRHTAVVAYC